MDVLDALAEILEAKAGIRKVRTPAGARRYGQPIGTPIRPDVDTGPVRDVVTALERATTPKPAKPSPLTAPLPKAFRRKFDAARAKLPDDSAEWFKGLIDFDRMWRRMDGSPGPESLRVEADIRAVGKVIDDEVHRRLKAAGIRTPLTERQRKAYRKKRQPLFDEWSERKWALMDEYAIRLYDKPWKQLATDHPQLWDSVNKRIIEKIHEDHPDLAELHRQQDALLQRLTEDERPYRDAYRDALQSVLSQLRPMGGNLKAVVSVGGERPIRMAAAPLDPDDPNLPGGPQSGVIPYQWRYQGPAWNPREPRPVVMDRRAIKDFRRLHPQDNKLVRQAIHDLEAGRAQLNAKTRELGGTYAVNFGDRGGRILVYPHVDGSWHIYGINPRHDYREAQRRMAVASGGGSERRRWTPVSEIPVVETITESTQARATMERVSRHYPTAWIEASNASTELVIGRSPTGRGFYRHDTTPGGWSELMFSNSVTDDSVGIHELAHRMERLFPAITAAEWAFHQRRTSKVNTGPQYGPEMDTAIANLDDARERLAIVRGGIARNEEYLRRGNLYDEERTRRELASLRETEALIIPQVTDYEAQVDRLRKGFTYLSDPEPIVKLVDLQPYRGYKDYEETKPDKFLNPYVGKVYGESPTTPYEVLSMGMEGLFTASQPMHQDNEHRHLVTGLLASV